MKWLKFIILNSIRILLLCQELLPNKTGENAIIANIIKRASIDLLHYVDHRSFTTKKRHLDWVLIHVLVKEKLKRLIIYNIKLL